MVVAADPQTASNQAIRFCRSRDGVRIAFASHGDGPPLVIVSCWLSNLQHDWESPVWRHFLDDLGAIATVVRYDERGFGLSDWSVTDFSLEARVADLEAVVDAAMLERFAILGMSGTSTAALAYVARHPERVTRLVMYGGQEGWPRNITEQDEADEKAFEAMVRAGWARPDPLFRRFFTTGFIPDATEEQMRWFDDLQRTSTSTSNMLAARRERKKVNLHHLLAKIRVPTLILHARDDRTVPFEEARSVAAGIAGARLVPLASRNHILLADEPAWQLFRDEMTGFMEADRRQRQAKNATDLASLSGRERQMLHLAADGLTNQEIAASLTLSVRTIERHMSNAYLKLGLSGRAARTAAVAALLRRAD